jgi:thymidylate synthase (FAD)
VNLVWATPDAEKMIERIGRVCYKSEDRITESSAGGFVRMLIQRGHEAMIEHASASFHIVCDRGVSHEIVRHRIASYAQESTRYCNYSKDKFGSEITVIEPPGLDDHGREAWKLSMSIVEKSYSVLIELGQKPEIARSVLPMCLKTEIVMTANLREWRHFLKLRTAPTAHPQMREVAGMIRERLVQIAPNVFHDFMTVSEVSK